MKQGTGKTRVAINLIATTEVEFVLFVCPFSIKGTLKREIELCSLDKPYEIIGYQTISSSDCQYLKLVNKVKEKKVFIVADESIFIKNDDSKRFLRLMELGKYCEYKLILNGTPITKNEWDIYNQMNFLSHKIINRSKGEFLNTFFTHIIYKRRMGKYKDFYTLSKVNIDYLKKLMYPYVFECDLSFEYKIKETNITIPASEEARSRYNRSKAILMNAIQKGECEVSMFINLALDCFTDEERHLQIASHLKGQTIVFCSLLKEVENIAKKIKCYLITGDTPLEERERILTHFKNDNIPLLMTFGTGAYGLNLQFCQKIAFASLTYDYGKLEQAKMRIKRLGQTKEIEYTYFTSTLGIYNLINDNIQKKRTLHDLMIKGLEGDTFEKIL